MPTITLNSRISSDGFLHLKVPSALTDTECKVTVILQPLTPTASKPKTPEELGWTPGFFERTAGAWEGEPLTREEQGEYEQREECLNNKLPSFPNEVFLNPAIVPGFFCNKFRCMSLLQNSF